MPYDPKKDPAGSSYAASDPMRFGRAGGLITPNDTADFNPYCKAYVVSSGTLQILPVMNVDNDWLDLGTVAAGQVIPWEIRRVKEGSTAVLASIKMA